MSIQVQCQDYCVNIINEIRYKVIAINKKCLLKNSRSSMSKLRIMNKYIREK